MEDSSAEERSLRGESWLYSEHALDVEMPIGAEPGFASPAGGFR